jgi:predicted nuclease of predicted toxin-antitoxin system
VDEAIDEVNCCFGNAFHIVWVNCCSVPQKNVEIDVSLSNPELFNGFTTQI